MVINNINSIEPKQDMVLVEVTTLVDSELVITEDSLPDKPAMRFAKVISMGPDVTSKEHCPGLKVGDHVSFTEFAGYHLAVDSKDIVKVIRGYDILSIITDMNNINSDTVVPTTDRLLVEELPQGVEQDGLFLGNASADPRLASLNYGKVLSIGPSCLDKTITKDSIVAYAPYVGETIREYESEDKKGLRVVRQPDVLLTMKAE
jgi:co-chaperonin GroES (HSP10)